MMFRRFILLVCLVFSALPAWAEDVLVFAAASLKEPLDRLAARHGGVTVSYAGSGTLARQVLAGAPADIVFLAHRDWMAELQSAGRIEGDAHSVLSNELVMIAQRPAAQVALEAEALLARLDGGRLAVGMTGSVPAGIYAKSALIDLKLWPKLKDHLAEVDNVRAALALVARGEAPLGIVYATDARVSDKVAIVARFPQLVQQAISYDLGVVAGRARPEVLTFAEHLRSEEALEVFVAAGFLEWGGP